MQVKRFLIAGLFITLLAGLAGCGTAPAEVCEHEQSGEWIQGEDTHYQICPKCGQKHDEEPHKRINAFGDICVIKSNRPATLRIDVPEGADGDIRMREVWLYVAPERDTLRLSCATSVNGTFANGKDISVAEGGWIKYEVPENLSRPDLYKFYRLEAKSADITVREIVFLGGAAGGELILMDAVPMNDGSGYSFAGLTDCRQFPASKFVCSVCGKELD